MFTDKVTEFQGLLVTTPKKATKRGVTSGVKRYLAKHHPDYQLGRLVTKGKPRADGTRLWDFEAIKRPKPTYITINLGKED